MSIFYTLFSTDAVLNIHSSFVTLLLSSFFSSAHPHRPGEAAALLQLITIDPLILGQYKTNHPEPCDTPTQHSSLLHPKFQIETETCLEILGSIIEFFPPPPAHIA